MVLLDTDTLTHLHGGHAKITQRLRDCHDPDIRITLITRIEILRGRFDFILKASNGEQLLRARSWLERSESLLAAVPAISPSQKAAATFDRLRQLPALRKIGRADLLLASIALAENALLVTRNLRHFRLVTGLRLENWVDA